MEFVAGRDYLVAPESRVLRLPDGSRIPFRTQAALYPPRGSPQSIAEAAGGRSNLFWSEGHVFHDLQVRVEYEHESRWSGTRPREADKELSRSIARLRRREAFRLVVLGDSISEGYNASGFVRAAPHQPPYAELVAERLRTHGNQSVILHNLSVAGKSTPWGLEQIPAVVREAPDLVVLAFGMNDASGRRSPTEFAANIRKMIEQARAGLPECEFILVASMVGNPEWSHSAPDLYPRYREELRKLQGPGVAVADLTTLWLDLLERKRFTDLTGNGVNHPNDYGHRLYAGMILGLLGRD
ncbi:MAG: SGNH/GDSL hydrolase family protein [Armatimonadetes bacterium]|nr:SGNH/GDSL hydrolase family protein [Armatimonadota bacterium]